MGYSNVLNQTTTMFLSDLKTLANAIPATVAFDMVAGSMVQNLMQSMPHSSAVFMVGMMSLRNMKIDPKQILHRQNHISGLHLMRWIKTKSDKDLENIKKQAVQASQKGGVTRITEQFNLDEFIKAKEFYVENMSKGKVLLCPNN